MLFVQEENFDTFVADVNSANKITVGITVSNDSINKLLNDYDSMIPRFAENKSAVTADSIVNYIGAKYIFN